MALRTAFVYSDLNPRGVLPAHHAEAIADAPPVQLGRYGTPAKGGWPFSSRAGRMSNPMQKSRGKLDHQNSSR